MDGRSRSHALNAILVVVFSSCLSGLLSAGDARERLRDSSPIYISPRLDREFLGAVSVDLRLDDKVTPRRAELALMTLLSPKGEKPTRYKTKLIPILLEKAPGSSEAYVVARLPADLIKPDETLTIRLIAASGDGERAALALCGGDGNVSREINLTQVRLPSNPVDLELEKADDAR
jgi:hypothetical protein